MNPYFGANILQFIVLFFERMALLLTGRLSLQELATDEVQVLVLSLVAIASSLIGTFLVLKKLTMLANSLSHTVLLGIVVAYLVLIPFLSAEEVHAHAISVTVLLFASLITGLITTVLTQALVHVLKLQEDASIGLVFTTLFALGVVLVTVFTRNTHLGIEAIMGNVDALHLHDLKLILGIALLNSVAVTLFFKEFKIITFDPAFADSIGFSQKLFTYLLMVLTSATVIGAFRAVGVLLVLAFLVGPPLTARLMTHELKKVLLYACVIGVGASFLSVAIARHLLSVHHFPISTSGLATTVLGVVYLSVVVLQSMKTKVVKKAD